MRISRRSDEGMLLAARTSPEAFAKVYERFERPILGFFMHATGRPEVAADLTGETFARALESVAQFDPARGRADQWLFGIARHVLGESLRRGRVDDAARRRLGLPALVLDDHATEVIARLSSGDGAVVRGLADLPVEQRSAVEARILGERDYAEIASELECSEALVRQRVSRGLRTLRTRLAGER